MKTARPGTVDGSTTRRIDSTIRQRRRFGTADRKRIINTHTDISRQISSLFSTSHSLNSPTGT